MSKHKNTGGKPHKHKLRTGTIQAGVYGGVTDPELESGKGSGKVQRRGMKRR